MSVHGTLNGKTIFLHIKPSQSIDPKSFFKSNGKSEQV